jgi:hypothetical protein
MTMSITITMDTPIHMTQVMSILAKGMPAFPFRA